MTRKRRVRRVPGKLISATLFLVALSGAPAAASDTATGAGTSGNPERESATAASHSGGPSSKTLSPALPPIPPPAPFSPPDVKTLRLDNGLKVQLAEDHRVPYVTAVLGIRSGTILDGQGKRGSAELTASMLKEGTKTRASKEIADEIDFIGGSLQADSDYDFTIVNGSCLSNYAGRLFALMSEVILRPSFPEPELKLKKTNWIQELTMKRSDPGFLLLERFRKVVFGEHPYGAIAPKAQTIASITRDDLKKYHSNNYIPNDSVLLIIGDFEPDKMEKLAKDSFGGWARGERQGQQLPKVAAHRGRRVYLVDRPDSAQSSIMLGNLGISKTDRDYFKSKVMNQILGASAHSRLFLNIREQKGYTYGAYSKLHARVHPDAFLATADVRTDVTAPSLKEFLFELERIREAQVTTEELSDAKNYIIGQYQLGLETQSGLAKTLLEVSLFDLSENYLSTFSDKIMSVTVADVQQAANKVIQSRDLVITVVGDAKKIRAALDPFGEIEVFDANGELNESLAPEGLLKNYFPVHAGTSPTNRC